MQLPLEYDEGHKTNDDKYGAEAQVGKEMAREITWARQGEQDEDRVQPSKRAWAPASQVEPQSERWSQQGPERKASWLGVPQPSKLTTRPQSRAQRVY